MKSKDVTAEELHQMASQAGINVPLELIKEKMHMLDQLSDEEEETKQTPSEK